jgi:DNA modification methylase
MKTIEVVSVGALKPYPRNARTHSKKQIRQIADSIQSFGFTNPVLVDDAGLIIAGHGRVEAAKLLGMREVPTLRLSHLNEAEKRAYIIADNRLAEKAGWDRNILAIELQSLIELEFQVELTGFETPEIDLLIEEWGEADNAHGPEDDVEETRPDRPAISRPGDLWILGQHRLLCGNALEASDYRALLGDEKAEMIMTDPPYNVRVDGHVGGLGKIKHREFAMGAGEMSEEEFTAFLKCVFNNLIDYSADGSIHFVFMDWRHLFEALSAGRDAYTELKNVVVWNKDNGGMGSLYRSKHELVLIWKNGRAPHVNNVELGRFGRNRTNVWDYAGVNTMRSGRMEELALHPTVKPVALLADAIKDCSRRNGLVLDPFCGSGTVLIAAERTGRRARAMEIDPLYTDTAVRRWQTYTGRAAILASTGEVFEEVERRLSQSGPATVEG